MNSRKSNPTWYADLANMALKALVVCAALYFVIEIGAGLALHFGWLR